MLSRSRVRPRPRAPIGRVTAELAGLAAAAGLAACGSSGTTSGAAPASKGSSSSARAERDRRVREAASVPGLGDLLRRRPAQLSSGQRQRVAMGRAVVGEPAVFLMDEPLSNLDARLRVQLRANILRPQRRLGAATLYVTHDQTEAMTMGDRVAVLRAGVLQQYGSRREL